MGWPLEDDGVHVRVELPENWNISILERADLQAGVLTDFMAGVQRASQLQALKDRLHERGLLG
jgi:uncharacterized protein YgfB (UPF0149 family)